jgi:hypothetical protein
MARGSAQPLTEIITRDISWRVKAADAYGSQLCHLHVLTVYKFWQSQPPGALSACTGLYRDCFTVNAGRVRGMAELTILYLSHPCHCKVSNITMFAHAVCTNPVTI